MRAASQVRLESAPVYTVTHPFTIAEVEYAHGQTLAGDLVRSWPSLIKPVKPVV